MRIGLITPAPPRSLSGNRVTALRWARIFRELGHRVTIAEVYGGEQNDLLVALHARRSYDSVRAFRRRYPGSPIVVALTGTDLYNDMRCSARARASVEMATRLVVLQPNALHELDECARPKARIIIQSASPPLQHDRAVRRTGSGRAAPTFDVCVVGHLRHVKDPFRAAMASRLLSATSRVRIVHIGSAMTEAMGRRARSEMDRNPRYVWLGERSPAEVWKNLTSCRVSVLSSRMEGGANAIGESVVAGSPVIASKIAGNIGLLGEGYPGYFAFGDTAELARLLDRVERDTAYLDDLSRRSAALATRFDPVREVEAWAGLLDGIDSHDSAVR